MTRRKTLTFKSPDKVKLFALIFVVAFILSPSIRSATSTALYTTADIISTHD